MCSLVFVSDLDEEDIPDMVSNIIQFGIELEQLDSPTYASSVGYVCRYWSQFRKDPSMALVVADLIMNSSPDTVTVSGAMCSFTRAAALAHFDQNAAKKEFIAQVEKYIAMENLSANLADMISEAVTVFFHIAWEIESFRPATTDLMKLGLEFSIKQLSNPQVENINNVAAELFNQCQALIELGDPESAEDILMRAEELVSDHHNGDLQSWVGAVESRFKDLPELLTAKAESEADAKKKKKKTKKGKSEVAKNKKKSKKSSRNGAGNFGVVQIAAIASIAAAAGILAAVFVARSKK
jgi:hypothetical protein